MKFVASYFVILDVLTIAAVGQAPSKLIDEFARISCSDIRYRSILFMESLAKDPKSVGFVVLSGRDDSHRFLRRWIIENEIIYRNFDRSRVVYLKRRGVREGLTELWKGEMNGSLPPEVETDWSYVKPKGSTPTVIVTRGYDESECATPSNEEYLSKFLRANPSSRGNVLIHCKGLRCYNEIRREVRKGFAKQKVNRVRYSYVPIRDMYYKIEYWLFP